MLEWLVEQSGAAGGLLFVMTRVDDPPQLAARLNENESGTQLQAVAQQYIETELAANALTTYAPASSVALRWSGPDEPQFRPVLLMHYGEAGYLITGLAVLRMRTGEAFVHPAEAASRVSRLLHEIGDRAGVTA